MNNSPESCINNLYIQYTNISMTSNTEHYIVNDISINNEITINLSNKDYNNDNFPCGTMCNIINSIYNNNNKIIIRINISSNNLSNDYIKKLINKFIEYNNNNNRKIIRSVDIRGNIESFKYNYIEDYYIIWK